MNWEVIGAAFVSHHGDDHQRKDDNDDHALFALGKNKDSPSGASFIRVTNWIFYSRFAKPFEAQETGIALAAGNAIR